MRWLYPFLILGLCGFGPIYTQHDSPEKLDGEFKNAYDQAQARQFRVFTATPNLNDLQDNEVIIVSSGAIKMMFRSGQEIFSINVTSVTVRR